MQNEATRRWAPYIVPFAVFLGILAIQDSIPLEQRAKLGLWLAVMSLVLAVFSRHVLSFRVEKPWASFALGAAVFVLWIAPDSLFPGYRSHWLFSNSITGSPKVSGGTEQLKDPVILLLRSLRAIAIVPVLEELFWRAWLMRWLIQREFWKLPLGSYTAASFWLTAVLFASEHGPYWDVGLAAGAIYNWWMVRTRSLGDLILTHAVTNACLCAYVIGFHKWEYWM